MAQRRCFTHTIKTLLEIKARLIERLPELDPDADAVLALWQENDCSPTERLQRRWAAPSGPSRIR